MAGVSAEVALPWACRRDEPLAGWTHCRIGGIATVFCEARTEADVLAAIEYRRAAGNGPKADFGVAADDAFVLGGGANVLINDARKYSLVLKLSEHFNAITVDADGRTARIEAGIYTPRLVREAARRGWEGYQFLAGVPGTLGGAVVMNAGVRELSTWDRVLAIEGITWEGERRRCSREELEPGYRRGNVPDDLIVTSAVCELPVGDPETIRRTARDLASSRRDSQPLHHPSWGSTFKNPSGASSTGETAGALIERTGLKGFRKGDAQISTVHANFIVNVGTARAAEALACIRRAYEAVREVCGVRLEPEVRLIGFPPADLAFLRE
ncbi:MAG TPA: UDP-N-acetylmuramate dehydrogenase [Gemmatimonadota bacterium]|nr:UDP-N-acetylmuramate dehydrogenase [Gemmatimonadota bacterium]